MFGPRVSKKEERKKRAMENEHNLDKRIALEEPAKLEDVERLLTLWRSLEDWNRAPIASMRFKHSEEVEEHLKVLRVGPAPEGLHEAVKQVWNSHESRWASRFEAVELRRDLEVLISSAARDLEDLEAFEERLTVRGRRLNALRLLSEVLDEFLLSGRDKGSKSDLEEQVMGSGDSVGETL
jgi:hypothetical protein